MVGDLLADHTLWCVMSQTFSKRKWLNKSGSHSSGSAFAYDGPSPWDETEQSTFLEVADCHCKVRLHKTAADSKKDFVKKLKTLRSVIDEFIDHFD